MVGKEYFNHMNLEAIVSKYPYRKNLPEEDILKGELLYHSHKVVTVNLLVYHLCGWIESVMCLMMDILQKVKYDWRCLIF